VPFLNPENNSPVIFTVSDHSSHVSSNSTLIVILFILPSTLNDAVEWLALLLYRILEVLVLILSPRVDYPDYHFL
jgi:hypothetical protein